MKELARRAAVHLDEANARSDLYAATVLRIGDSGINGWVLNEDPDACRADVADAMARWSSRGFHLEHYYELRALTNVDLFAGRAREAHARIVAQWGSLNRSLLLRVQFVRVIMRRGRAAAAIAAATESAGATRELCAEAKRLARAIAGERMAWATPIATLIEAGALAAGGAGADANVVALLRRAAAGFDGAQMALFAAATRRSLGKVIGGDEGRELVRAAEAWMASQTIENTRAMTAMLAPGFSRFE
jgi:hypothetical protein